jgi:signal transduction histidine kinase
MAIGSAALDADRFLPEFLGEVALLAVPIAIGDAARSRADRLSDLIDTEANNRVQAERIRIARDLHDVVAHGLSTITIQSGVAAHLLDQDPGQAREALELINATGKRSLEELRTMVGVLRSTDEAPLRPTPTDPNDLTDLLDGAAHAGITVTTETTGSFPPDVGDSCVVAMHRIIQEALTNVARHAGAAATTLNIDHAADHVEVRITNEGGTARNGALESTGVGIIGMRERAESLGGTLTAEPTADGRFLVTAVLPYSIRREHTS